MWPLDYGRNTYHVRLFVSVSVPRLNKSIYRDLSNADLHSFPVVNSSASPSPVL
jgi:hypothetical protein